MPESEVEKMEVEEKAEEKAVEEKEPEETEAQKFLNQIAVTLTRDFPVGTQGDVAILARAVQSFYFYRARSKQMGPQGLHVITAIMKVFTGKDKNPDVDSEVPSVNAAYNNLQHCVGDLVKTLTGIKSSPPPDSCFVECASFLVLLSTLAAADQLEEANEFAFGVLSQLWIAMMTLNRRSTDFIAAKVCFYRVLFHNKLKGCNTNLRDSLLQDYRTCVLNHNEPCQAVLTNLILQTYLADTLISQASKFVDKASMPDRADPYQIARFCFYSGRVDLVQLQYDSALKRFRMALRKAPQKGAIGFKQVVTKYFVVTMLLMGEIPERNIFRQDEVKASLVPYFKLTQAVRVGDMQMFTETVDEYYAKFDQDGVYMLITRLRHNVIKAALRKISVSYSRIHLDDVAKKLNLNSALEAEYIVAKAIKDGVIDAVIHHQTQTMRSTEMMSVYSTVTPQRLLDTRIEFCLNLHRECVKALRYKEEEEEKEEKKEDDEDGKCVEELVEEVLKRLEKDGDDDDD